MPTTIGNEGGILQGEVDEVERQRLQQLMTAKTQKEIWQIFLSTQSKRVEDEALLKFLLRADTIQTQQVWSNVRSVDHPKTWSELMVRT